MSQDNLIGFGECVIALHEKLSQFVKQSDLFEELNSMIHKIMDTTVERRFSRNIPSSSSNSSREASFKEIKNPLMHKKAYYSCNSSKENRVSDFKMIKPCYVKLDKMGDKQLSNLLARKRRSDSIQSSGRNLTTPSLQSVDMVRNPSKNLRPVTKINASVNITIDPKFLATEDHLDLLMAREMGSLSTQVNKKVVANGQASKCVKDANLNPVVVLNRLSSEFISKAINGKLKLDSHQLPQKRKRKTLKRIAPFNEVRRSKRSSVVKSQCSCCSISSSSGLRRSKRLSSISPTEGRNSFFYVGRNSCPSRRQYKNKDKIHSYNGRETIFGNKENIPRLKKRTSQKTNYSDDEEEFYGFENQTKNAQRIKKMKEALKTLNGQPSGKERRRIIKVNKSLKTVKKFRPLLTGKGNGKNNIFNGDFRSLIRHKVPFKAVNRVEAQRRSDEDMFKNNKIEDYQSSISYRDNDLNVRNEMMMVRRNSVQHEDAGSDVMSKRLEILKLFKQREKVLINKLVRDQGKQIVSKTGELMNDDNLFNYYSGNYYIKKIGRRTPLWAEESIRNVIIESQEQIPTDIIAGYFQDDNVTDPTRIADFLGSAFLEKNDIDIAVKVTVDVVL